MAATQQPKGDWKDLAGTKEFDAGLCSCFDECAVCTHLRSSSSALNLNLKHWAFILMSTVFVCDLQASTASSAESAWASVSFSFYSHIDHHFTISRRWIAHFKALLLLCNCRFHQIARRGALLYARSIAAPESPPRTRHYGEPLVCTSSVASRFLLASVRHITDDQLRVILLAHPITCSAESSLGWLLSVQVSSLCTYGLLNIQY